MSISETISISRPDLDGNVTLTVEKPEDDYWLEIAVSVETNEYEVRMVLGHTGERPCGQTILRLGDGAGQTSYASVRNKMNVDPEGVVQRVLLHWDKFKEFFDENLPTG